MQLEEKAGEDFSEKADKNLNETKKFRAGSSKTFRKAQLDVTDEKLLTSDELQENK